MLLYTTIHDIHGKIMVFEIISKSFLQHYYHSDFNLQPILSSVYSAATHSCLAPNISCRPLNISILDPQYYSRLHLSPHNGVATHWWLPTSSYRQNLNLLPYSQNAKVDFGIVSMTAILKSKTAVPGPFDFIYLFFKISLESFQLWSKNPCIKSKGFSKSS